MAFHIYLSRFCYDSFIFLLSLCITKTRHRQPLMISKNTIKQIRSLELRKFRKQSGTFIAEGNKLVEDNLASMKCHRLIAVTDWWKSHEHLRILAEECIEVSREEMEKISLMQSPQEVLATFYVPSEEHFDLSILSNRLVLALDSIQDPGNLGTIIRLCDWFGIHDIFCSQTTADCFSPKVVQATMGAIARVRIHYLDLQDFLKNASSKGIPVYGTFLEGENIYMTNLSSNGIIVMGNEGQGISPEIEAIVSKKINIPSYPAESETSESLNVGIATAITVAEFRRRC